MAMTLKPADTLYHGSPLLVEVLRPHKSKLVNMESVVFAATSKAIALCFCSTAWKDSDLDLGLVNGEPVLKELRKDALKLLNIPGYLYHLSAQGFKSDPRIAAFEKINTKKVYPHRIFRVENVLEELKTLDIEIIEF